MARFGYANSFSSNRSVSECLQVARDVLASAGCKNVDGQGGAEITGTAGMGWAIRLVGGLMAPATWFPVKLSVSIVDAGDRREINVRADENFGVGSLLGVEQKMRSRCDELGNQINSLLVTRLG